jgi:hypothetical protein
MNGRIRADNKAFIREDSQLFSRRQIVVQCYHIGSLSTSSCAETPFWSPDGTTAHQPNLKTVRVNLYFSDRIGSGDCTVIQIGLPSCLFTLNSP